MFLIERKRNIEPSQPASFLIGKANASLRSIAESGCNFLHVLFRKFLVGESEMIDELQQVAMLWHFHRIILWGVVIYVFPKDC